ncbi:hypothetical protein Tco_0736720, partial [Tanacetum coccineum]
MRELREDTFSENKNEDAHKHVEQILDIISLFNIPRVLQDAVMLCVFPFTFTGATKRWVDRLTLRAVNTWELLKNAFIQRYCPPSKTAKQLEDIHNFKQEGDESLYQAWERYNYLLYKCPTYDINSHQKEWHDGSSSRNIGGNNSTNGLAGIVSKIDNLGRDMKKLKENVHTIQVGCQICKGPHLDKEYPLNKEVKGVEEVKTTTEAPSSSTGQCKAFITDNKAPLKPTFSKVHGVSFLSDTNLQIVEEENVEQTKVLSCQLPPKELNPGSFTPPCTIGKLIFYAMTDLGASVNVLPRGIYEYLKLTNLMRTDMLVEMADMTKKAPLGITKNIL